MYYKKSYILKQMRWYKALFCPLISLTTVSIIFTTISCGWTINAKDDDHEIKKEEWKERKFNYPVMPEWEDLNIIGHNEKEWARLQVIYTKEIKNGKKQLDEMDQGLKDNANDNDFKNFYQMVAGLTKNMILWYKQIYVEIELNLWLINNNLNLDNIQLIKNKAYQETIKQIIEKITESKQGFYPKWTKQFKEWFTWMKEQEYLKQSNKQWLKDKVNWLRVETHLNNKNIYFKSILEKMQL